MELNILAILIAGIASMALGFFWYSPALFGKPWMKLMGYTEKSIKEAQKKMGPMYGVSFIATLITAFILSHVITFSGHYFGDSGMIVGIRTGFFMWLGFIAPVQMTDVIFGGKPWKLFHINTGYQLASTVVMGAIISMM